jgi:hypothetical protein
MAFVMEEDESAYPVDITFFGAMAEMSPAANFLYTIKQAR